MTEELFSANTRQRDVYTVSRLNREARSLLERGLGTVWLEGEISNLARPTSGHLYFSLKDEQAQIRCAFFRNAQRGLGFVPEDGIQVLVRARASLYEARGEFQLIVDRMEPSGEGALRRAFELLKRQLQEEGLFDSRHKRALPTLPKRIGIVTSPAGAVLHDILTTLRRRFPGIAVLLYPVPVQGDGAGEEIAATIRLADKRAECDALILARGGGSLEDLRAFNEEVVARAIFDCALPLVCGVGHETDFTIADLVADMRAPTPTAAAEMLSPDRREWLARFHSIQQHLSRLMVDHLNDARQSLDWASSRLVHPRERIQRLYERLDLLSHRLRYAQRSAMYRHTTRLLAANARLRRQAPPARIQAMRLNAAHLQQRLFSAVMHRMRETGQQLHALGGRLHTLSPLATLDRGYSILTDSATGILVRDAGRLKPGDRVHARVARGSLECKVEELHEAD